MKNYTKNPHTIKDLIFTISVIIWLFSNVLSFIFYKSDGIFISNLLCMSLFGIMTIIKMKNKKFGNWLENKI